MSLPSSLSSSSLSSISRDTGGLGRGEALGRTAVFGRGEALGRLVILGRGEALGRLATLGLGDALGLLVILGFGEALGRLDTPGVEEALGRAAPFGRGERAPLALTAAFLAEEGVSERSLFAGVTDLPRACGTWSLDWAGLFCSCFV